MLTDNNPSQDNTGCGVTTTFHQLDSGGCLDCIFNYLPQEEKIPILIDDYEELNWDSYFYDDDGDDNIELGILLSYLSLDDHESKSNKEKYIPSNGITVVPDDYYAKNQSKGKFIGVLSEITPLSCFKLIFTDDIQEKFLSKMNDRRQSRVDHIKLREGTRGKPLQPNIKTDRLENRENYVKRWTTPFTLEDSNKFLSCFLAMSVSALPTLHDYWENPTLNNLGLGLFFQNRLPKHKFLEMYRCIDIDVDDWLDSIKEKAQSIWDVSTNVSIDESMIPHKGRKCPHHVFIPRKPHPHGMKLFTAACESGYIFNWMLHKRTSEEPKDLPFHRVINPHYERGAKSQVVHSWEVVSAMIQPLTKHHVLYMDSYYGGMQVFNIAMEKKHDIVMSCRQDRPAVIFKNGTYTLEQNELGVKSMRGTTYKGYSFAANSIPRGGVKRAGQSSEQAKSKKVKFTNIMSSLHDATAYVPTQREIISGDDYLKDMDLVPASFHDYLKHMGGVDRANSSIMSAYYRHRVFRWRVAVWIWTMNLMVHNARIIYNSLSPKPMTQSEFIIALAKTMYEVPTHSHKLVPIPNGEKLDCRICYRFYTSKSGKKKRSKSTHMCTICGPIHVQCFNKDHDRFVLDSVTGGARSNK
ncbi:hypothetical protein C9374_014142 [Naegleria lovaniensis]|uniref:PiggyBac transposable element-derived protein domain-containing protein n=1 Tax=Naegleria lovaniensis TaxID=51637 RepID=A0AA88GYS6_NAELO|nr:uncharacterized protein C9374_014142 [Naegleria lovaniensis]KAG2389582.1 hypothetical protein C9374_014142 [Naegleria lovaniensis]